MRAIQRELGEEDGVNSEVNEYREKLRKMKASKEVKEKISKEIEKFAKTPTMSPDSSIIRTYLRSEERRVGKEC